MSPEPYSVTMHRRQNQVGGSGAFVPTKSYLCQVRGVQWAYDLGVADRPMQCGLVSYFKYTPASKRIQDKQVLCL